ncbi:MAG: 1-deoxy-D-xylulose-5-phosphate reductoisomerase [Clostridia bacterium]|nr:1-deoxy-D-xylulose-5-phosphate reductoisomerase [Clostridia bacterium]
MKRVSILGSTGSIGTQALNVIENSGTLCVSALAANSNVKLIEEQIRRLKPQKAALFSEDKAKELKIAVADTDTKVLSGEEGVCEVAEEGDITLTALSGSIGIKPTIRAIRAGCDIALANKETMVCAGDIINREAAEHNIKILPVDSEHGAIFQCIRDEGKSVRKILLTASGGPFFGKTAAEIENATVEDALNHPNWSMGSKITIDSATLINKGLEVIEAVRLFGVKPSQIQVLIHRQSIVHSMVEFTDNSVLAQLGTTDMRIPIAYALNYPERLENPASALDFLSIPPLTFAKPDTETFRGLALAFDAIGEGGTMPAVFNGANEASVSEFLSGKCTFGDIARLVEYAMSKYKTVKNPSLETIIESDLAARRCVLERGKTV